MKNEAFGSRIRGTRSDVAPRGRTCVRAGWRRELRAGQFGYNFGLISNTTATRFEDLATSRVEGGGRDWLNKRRRNQYTGAFNYFKDNFAGGSHTFKVGGEYLDESGNILWQQGNADTSFTSSATARPTRCVSRCSGGVRLEEGQRRLAAHQRAAAPFEAYNVPVTIIDPGPDGSAATTADNGPSFEAFNLDSTARGSSQVTQNIPGYEGTYKTFEISGNKRYGQRWSMTSSFSYTWTEEYGNTYANNRFALAVPGGSFSFFGSFPQNPNEKTLNTFTNWNAKFFGTIDAGWGIWVTPAFKIGSGAPYGRFISANLNYNSAQLILVEPIGTRRQDTVRILDFRVERELRLAPKARLGLFMDVFNTFNSNTAVNINWRSGASFEKATTVMGPRIVKFGLKFDW